MLPLDQTSTSSTTATVSDEDKATKLKQRCTIKLRVNNITAAAISGIKIGNATNVIMASHPHGAADRPIWLFALRVWPQDDLPHRPRLHRCQKSSSYATPGS